MNKKGFTLIEMIAVIVIIGVLLLIAIPSVSSIIFSSRDNGYANDISAYLTEVNTLYKSKKFGPLLDEKQIMIVPIKDIEFEKNDTKASPYGALDLEKSIVIVERTQYGNKLYASIIDSTNRGVFELESDKLTATSIEMTDQSLYTSVLDYFKCGTGTKKDYFEVKPLTFNFRGKVYTAIATRNYNKIKCSTTPSYYPLIVLETH